MHGGGALHVGQVEVKRPSIGPGRPDRKPPGRRAHPQPAGQPVVPPVLGHDLKVQQLAGIGPRARAHPQIAPGRPGGRGGGHGQAAEVAAAQAGPDPVGAVAGVLEVEPLPGPASALPPVHGPAARRAGHLQAVVVGDGVDPVPAVGQRPRRAAGLGHVPPRRRPAELGRAADGADQCHRADRKESDQTPPAARCPCPPARRACRRLPPVLLRKVHPGPLRPEGLLHGPPGRGGGGAVIGRHGPVLGLHRDAPADGRPLLDRGGVAAAGPHESRDQPLARQRGAAQRGRQRAGGQVVSIGRGTSAQFPIGISRPCFEASRLADIFFGRSHIPRSRW